MRILAKQNQTTDDFYLGGRTLGPLVTAMSAEASDMSSWLLMGLPGVAYLSGTADAAWTAIGLAIGTYVNWLVVAKRLRNYTHVCGNSTTLPLFFSNRYRDNKRILSVIAALLIIIFFVPYTASGFAACGKLFTKPVRNGLSAGNADQCDRYRSLHHTGRIPRSKYDRLCPEYCYGRSRSLLYLVLVSAKSAVSVPLWTMQNPWPDTSA